MATRRGVVEHSRQPLIGAERAVLVVLAAGALFIPTIFSRGMDVFRLPKELFFRTEAIALLALAVFWATARRRTWTAEVRSEFVVVAAIVCWTVVTVAASTNRLLSFDSLITVVAAAVIFVATCLAAQTTSMVAVDVLMAACCVNATVVIAQELKIWNPFVFSERVGGHYTSVALLGNPNDVGMYLVAPAIASVIVAVVASGVRRWIYTAIAALLIAGLAASGTRTAFGAFAAALIVFAISHSRRAAAAGAGIVVLLALVALSPATSIGRGVRDLADALGRRDYERLSSERLVPFLAAIDMTRDHPLLGVGPGCFKYHYMAYRVALQHRYPKAWTRGWPANAGTVHNDHLQVAAEAGLPGYALFLTAIGVGATTARRARRRGNGAGLEREFGRALRWPLATVVFVLCLAQFPLELAAPRLMLISLAALCVTWSRDDVAS